MEIATLPKHASELRAWLDNVIDAATACARDAEKAFAWIMAIERDGCTFEELGVIDPEHASLEAKIRYSISKHMTGSEAERTRT